MSGLLFLAFRTPFVSSTTPGGRLDVKARYSFDSVYKLRIRKWDLWYTIERVTADTDPGVTEATLIKEKQFEF
jgi:hypothetical protein